jgi:glycosyltransferase involved in cell wall biosynthesis
LNSQSRDFQGNPLLFDSLLKLKDFRRMGKKIISVVISAYNEELGVRELARQLKAAFERTPAYEFEVILVENGSTDRTLEKMLEGDPSSSEVHGQGVLGLFCIFLCLLQVDGRFSVFSHQQQNGSKYGPRGAGHSRIRASHG